MSPIVAAHHKLMGTRYQFKSIGVIELFRDILTEGVAGTSGRDTPAATIIGVRPEQIADGSLVGHFLDAIELSDLIECID